MILKKIQFEKEVKLMNTVGFLGALAKKNSNENLQLKEDAMKDLIGSLSVMNLMGLDWSTEEKFEKNLSSVVNPDNICSIISRKYIQLLFDELPDYSKSELMELTVKEYRVGSVMKDENLMDYAVEHVCDEINLLRLFEYGWFVMHHLTKEIFENIPEAILGKFNEIIGRTRKSFDEMIYDKINRQATGLSEFEWITLLAVFNYQFRIEDLTFAYMYDYAYRFQEDGLKLNRSIKKFKELSEKIVKNELRMNKRRGRRI